MKFLSKKDSIYFKKPEGTAVNYYLFPEYEIHYNEQPPETTQPWHHHDTINESILMLEGEMWAHWLENGKKKKRKVKKGDLVEVENTPHTFINSSKKKIKFVVFRFVPTGKNTSQVIKKDKVLDTHLE